MRFPNALLLSPTGSRPCCSDRPAVTSPTHNSTYGRSVSSGQAAHICRLWTVDSAEDVILGSGQTGTCGPATSLPKLVDCVLYPHVPDDVADKWQQEPEAPHSGDPRLLARVPIHPLYLIGHEKESDRKDEDSEQQKGNPADTVTPIVLEFLAVPVGPEPRPESECHDRYEDRESN